MARTEWPDLRPSLFRRFRAAIVWALAAIVVIAVALSVAGFVYESQARQREAGRFEPPGTMVDIGGRRLHAVVRGEGSPTVVFEAGLGGSSLDWWKVAPKVATYARTVVYDRAGLGWSDPAPGPRDAEAMASDLHALLTHLDIEPPYVLVGHSLAGYVLRVYQSHHPKAVAGMVLVDASHENQWNDLNAGYRYLLAASPYAYRAIGLLDLVGFTRILSAVTDGPIAGELVFLPDAVRKNQISRLVLPGFVRAVADETEGIMAGAEQVRATRTDLGDLPVVVLTANENADPATSPIPTWESLQKDQASLSSRGVQRTVEDSSHYIQFDQPGAVLDAIQEVVDAARLNAAFTVTPINEADPNDAGEVWRPRPATP